MSEMAIKIDVDEPEIFSNERIDLVIQTRKQTESNLKPVLSLRFIGRRINSRNRA